MANTLESRLFRSQEAREAAERALVNIVHHYGGLPEFVVLGGLVPEILCVQSNFQHAGTIDVDVQVNLEIECGSINATRLEKALQDARFVPDSNEIWRWIEGGGTTTATVKFELLADLPDKPVEAKVKFTECERLGAVNLRGTGFASRDVIVRELSAQVGETFHSVRVNVTGLAGFLLAKIAAVYLRRKDKDWYDIAFVLLHNDAGGPANAAGLVRKRFTDSDLAIIRPALDDLQFNFATPKAQGTQAYIQQMQFNHFGLDSKILATDAMLAVREFSRVLRLNW